MRPSPTGRESTFEEDELIVTKTDLRGRITYANEVMVRVSGYSERELLGEPHSLIRHPAMPRCVFKLLWDRIEGGEEVFAYVVNLCKNGNHYWVLAHVTPTLDGAGAVRGYHSSRRQARPSALAVVKPMYERLAAAERAQASKGEAVRVAGALLGAELSARGLGYDEFVFELEGGDRA
jgi:PAS domain S-box-containing protein